MSSRSLPTIKSNERVMLVGRTGSGKTFLAERLTAPLRRLVIVDPGGVLEKRFQPHIAWEKGIKELEEGLAARIYLSLDNPYEYESYFAHIYERVPNVTVYIDELYGVALPTRPSQGLWALYTRGRGRGIGVWASTQRPRFVPRFTLSESEWFFVFRLTVADDRKFLGSIIHKAVENEIKKSDPHGFYYTRINWDKPRYSSGLITS